ncbi:phosphotransferase family protein [Serinicoccus kebangsaanensis]|uniref:phosphotransferase family protein n=1 Tax=Serinicoccus kebangsaanensis TaxID=2602069 RepID=UPI00124F6C4B|nr:aminoglycoside phosphotransferase family protein [Serinicoccus kebangsaanensis]
MRSAPALLAQAITQGVIACADVLEGAAQLVPVSRSNLVHRLELRGRPVAFVKQQGHATATDGLDTVTREALVLGEVAGGPVPQVLHVDDDAVWTSAVAGHPLDSCLPADPRRVAAALGESLAALHRHPVRPSVTGPEATRPWPVTGAAPATVRSAPSGTPAADLADRVTGGEGPDSLALRRAGRRWRRSHWIHGDLSVGNVLVHLRADGSPVARFVDLEDGGLGDPSWDVVCALRVVDDVLLLADVEPARQALLAAYLAAGGSGRPDPGLALAHDVMADTRSALGELAGRGGLAPAVAS